MLNKSLTNDKSKLIKGGDKHSSSTIMPEVNKIEEVDVTYLF
jgi:hypothetical protein